MSRITMETRLKDPFSFKDLFGREWLYSFLSAIALLTVAYVVEYFATKYVLIYSLRPTSNPVGDLILDNIPVVDLNFIIIEAALIAIILSAIFVFSKPRYIIFALKLVAIFIIIRSLSISLTHVGIHPENIAPGLGFFDSIYVYLNFQTGLFFSGHTGLPFLMALMLWDNLRARYLFLILSFIFGLSVLLAHVHYSIDVFAAPFMAYGIFEIARYLFRRDYELMKSAP